jgi:hypothetical protein
MPFMLRYAELFHKNDILTKIMPRKIESAEMLDVEMPYLLNEASS